MKRLHEMNRTELAAWYEAQVGYNPVTEDPSLSDAELLRDCQDYEAEADMDTLHKV